MDKPEEIIIGNKRKIEYPYDAVGSLLQKTEPDHGRDVKKVITYIAGFVYEKTLASNGNAATVPDTVPFLFIITIFYNACICQWRLVSERFQIEIAALNQGPLK